MVERLSMLLQIFIMQFCKQSYRIFWYLKKICYLCSIRTCQASQRCSNRRVVFLLYLYEIEFHQTVFLPGTDCSDIKDTWYAHGR